MADELLTRIEELLARNSRLILEDTHLGTSGVNALVADSPLAGHGLWFVATGVLQEEGGRLRQGGTTRVLGMLEDAPAVLELWDDPWGDTQLELRIQCAPAWRLSHSIPELEGSPLAELSLFEPSFTFSTVGVQLPDGRGLSPGLAFTAELLLEGPCESARSLLALPEEAPRVLLGGQIGGTPTEPTLSLLARVDAEPQIGPLQLRNGVIGAFLVRGDGAAAEVDVDLYFGADLLLGGRLLYLTGRLTPQGDIFLRAEGRDGLVCAEDLDELLGGEGWRSPLPAELQSLTDVRLGSVAAFVQAGPPRKLCLIEAEAGLPLAWSFCDGRYELRNVLAKWACHWPLLTSDRFHTVTISAEAEVEGRVIALELESAEGGVVASGHFTGSESFDLATLSEVFLGGTLSVPAGLLGLDLQDVRVSLNPDAEIVSLAATTRGQVDLFGLAPIFDPLVVEAECPTQGTPSATVTGFLTLDEFMFSLTASVSPENARGSFEGQLFREEPLRLRELIGALLPPELQLPSALGDLGIQDPQVTADLSDRRFTLAGRLADAHLSLGGLVDFEAYALAIELAKQTPSAWEGDKSPTGSTEATGTSWWAGVELSGRLELAGFELAGKLRVDPRGFRFEPDPPATHRVTLPLQQIASAGAPQPSIQFRLGTLWFFSEPDGGWSVGGGATIDVRECQLPSMILDRLPPILVATVEGDRHELRLAVRRLFQPFAFDLSNLALDAAPCELGSVCVDACNLQVSLGDAVGLSAEIGLGLPASLNGIFGPLGGAGFAPFVTYDEERPEESTVRLAFQATPAGAVELQFLSSPVCAWEVWIEEEDAPAASAGLREGLEGLEAPWVPPAWDPARNVRMDVDLGPCGALRGTSPIFGYDATLQEWRASGRFETQSLAIPTGLLGALFRRAGLDPLAQVLPESLRLRDVLLADEEGSLDTDAFSRLAQDAGVGLPSLLQRALAAGGRRLQRLPSRLHDYLRIEVPSVPRQKFRI